MKFRVRRKSPAPDQAAKLEPRAKAKSAASEGGWRTPSGFLLSQDRVPILDEGPIFERIAELAGLIATGHISVGRRGLAVCGAAEGAGVTFVAVNLAVALAMSGYVIRLVETNLRHPSLETIIRPPQTRPGLSDYLHDETLTSFDVIHPEVLPGLSVIYAGSARAGAPDLLASDRFMAFTEACLRDVDLTIFDTSPANRAVDARVAAKVAGYALIVARRGRSFVEDVVILSTQLNQDGVVLVGSVMNGS